MLSLVSNMGENLNSPTKAELVITAMQERIGQMTANYETQIAILRAEVTQLSDELKKYKNVQEENSSDATSNGN